MGKLVGIWALACLFSITANADLQSLFDTVNNSTKGPFGDNVLQGSSGRNIFRDNPNWPSGAQFHAAFRNSAARTLADEHDFYLGNLFTTNYYELMGDMFTAIRTAVTQSITKS